MMKKATNSGSMSQIVLLLNSALDEETVRSSLSRFAGKFPVLSGRVARDFKLTPYWKIPGSSRGDILLQILRVADEASLEMLPPALIRTANSRFRDDREHIAFHLFLSGKRSLLAMTFDHRLFDARGAEFILDLFQKSVEGHSSDGDIEFTSSMELTQWGSKFLAGRSVNRKIIALSRSTPQALPYQTGRDKGFQYRLMTFDKQETAAIYDRAYAKAGYLLESPYFLSLITQAVHELFRSRPASGTSYVIPVTTDLRSGKDSVQEVFFNHVSYLYYQIPVQDVEDEEKLIASLKQQMYDQVKSGFPRDLATASLLTRIAPKRLLGKLLHLPLKGRMATFAFSHLGKSAYSSAEFMGAGIDNIFHMPRVPVPPGLGFFSNYYNGRLNLIISYLDGMLTDDEAANLVSGIRMRFGKAQA